MELKYHNPISQMVPDAMHTVKVVMEHLLYLIIGKEDSEKGRLKLSCKDSILFQLLLVLHVRNERMSLDWLLFVPLKKRSSLQTNVHAVQPTLISFLVLFSQRLISSPMTGNRYGHAVFIGEWSIQVQLRVTIVEGYHNNNIILYYYIPYGRKFGN